MTASAVTAIMTSMSHEHIVYVVIGTVAVSVVVVIAGFVQMNKMLREAQRLTRAVAGLVVQESERVRALFRDS